ncbi:MAG: class I SAM-dependent methyltransferase [Candidatus Bathyarchaeia archaeon]
MPKILRDLTARLISLALPRVAWDKRYYRQWEKAGYHVTPNHFFFPIPNTASLTDGLWEQESKLVGVEMHLEKQLELLNEVFPKYARENLFPKTQTSNPNEFYLDNGSFGSVDAEVLHVMIRHFKPRRVIEIGSGYSTLVSAKACQLNKQKDGVSTELIAIEPYPNETLKQGFPGLTELIKKPLENVDLDIFSGLGENDILFIDSTHVLKIGGDVKYLYLEVLPRVAGGVIVHSHDIFFPYEYPKSWVKENHWFWTEQYLLQAFLAFNSEFEVMWASQYMSRRYPKELAKVFQSYNEAACPGSLWLKRKVYKSLT